MCISRVPFMTGQCAFQKLRVLQGLMEQLGDDPRELHYLGRSPVHKKVIQLRLADSSPGRHSTGKHMTKSAALLILI